MGSVRGSVELDCSLNMCKSPRSYFSSKVDLPNTMIWRNLAWMGLYVVTFSVLGHVSTKRTRLHDMILFLSVSTTIIIFTTLEIKPRDSRECALEQNVPSYELHLLQGPIKVMLLALFKGHPLVFAIFSFLCLSTKCLELSQFNGFDTALTSNYLNLIN